MICRTLVFGKVYICSGFNVCRSPCHCVGLRNVPSSGHKIAACVVGMSECQFRAMDTFSPHFRNRLKKARSSLSRPPHTDAKMTRSLTRSLQVKPDHRRLSNNIVTGKRPLKEEFVLLLNYASASISISRVLPGQALDAFLYRVSHKAGRTWIKGRCLLPKQDGATSQIQVHPTHE